jgi:hypothetical protein
MNCSLSRLLTQFVLIFIVSASINSNSLFAFQSDSTASSNISLESMLEKTEVPLNKSVKLTINLSWEGKSDRYKVDSVEEPILTNLEIYGSSSSSKTELRNGTAYTIKSFEFTLRPVEMGMSYVDPLIIAYTETSSENNDHLLTNRLSIKVLQPEYEADYGWMIRVLIWVGVAIIVGVGGYLTRKNIMKKRQPEEAPLPPVEDKYFEKLEAAKGNSFDSYRRRLDEVVSLFRGYVIEKFDIPLENRSDNSLIEFLYGIKTDEDIIQQIRSIFDSAEQLRFSGAEVMANEFELTLGSVEAGISRIQKLVNPGESTQLKSSFDSDKN